MHHVERTTDFGKNAIDLYGFYRSLEPNTPSVRRNGGAYLRLGYQGDVLGVALGPLVLVDDSIKSPVLPSFAGHFGYRELFFYADFLPDVHSLERGVISTGIGASKDAFRGTLGLGVIPDLSGNGSVDFRIGKSPFWLGTGLSVLTSGVTGPQWFASGRLSYDFERLPTHPQANNKPPGERVLALPRGWRFPTDSDRSGYWAATTTPSINPYHIKTDFDGNGLEDEAWILFRSKVGGWGVWVFHSYSAGLYDRTLLFESKTSDAQIYGIGLVAPGVYKTACGKGYRECTNEEPERLTLTLPAIDFYRFESANSFFYWDENNKRFQRTWMSD